jgi:hypothetical protein
MSTFPHYFKRVTLFVGTINGVFHQCQSELPRRDMTQRRGQEIRVASCACGHEFGLTYTADERERAYVSHIAAVNS